MVSSVKFTLVLIILATASCTSYALKCHQCNSKKNVGCNNTLEGKTSAWIIDCPKDAIGCFKGIVEKDNRVDEVARDCNFPEANKFACKENTKVPPGAKLKCYVCAKDLCNGSSFVNPFAVTLLLFFGLSHLLG